MKGPTIFMSNSSEHRHNPVEVYQLSVLFNAEDWLYERRVSGRYSRAL
jgi:hypothetical protein